jgi:hypothetical protein
LDIGNWISSKTNMLIKYFLLILCSIHLTIAVHNQRGNLARRHPCNSLNKRLEPYIKWTEKLASTQYKGEYFFLKNFSSGEKKESCVKYS